MNTNIPLTVMPGLSWSAIIEKIHGSGTAQTDVYFFLERSVNFLKMETKDISVLEVGFSIGNHLVEFSKQGCCRVNGIVYNLDFLDEVVTQCINEQCDVRLYLSSDEEIRQIQNIHVLIVPGTTFLQIADSETKIQEYLSLWKTMLSQKSVVIIEVGTTLTRLEGPYSFINSDDTSSMILQQIQTCNDTATRVKETLTYQAASGTERIAVQNIRTFHMWNYSELVRMLHLAGFTEVLLDNVNGKQYLVVYKDTAVS